MESICQIGRCFYYGQILDKGAGDGIFQRFIQGAGCPAGQDFGEFLQFLLGEQHQREAGERADFHADDGGVFLREDLVGGSGGATVAFL